jgi:hypothetical protein
MAEQPPRVRNECATVEDARNAGIAAARAATSWGKAKTLASLTDEQNQTRKSNDLWSEWQDLNLRPLRPERSALPG